MRSLTMTSRTSFRCRCCCNYRCRQFLYAVSVTWLLVSIVPADLAAVDLDDRSLAAESHHVRGDKAARGTGDRFEVVDDSQPGTVSNNYKGRNRLPAADAMENNKNSIKTLTSHIPDRPSASPVEIDHVWMDRSRRSAELASDDDQDRVRPATASKRRGRWSKTNVQIWGKRSPSSVEVNEDDGKQGSANEGYGEEGDQLKRAWHKNNFKIWGKRLQRLPEQVSENQHGDYNFRNAPELFYRPPGTGEPTLVENVAPSSGRPNTYPSLRMNEDETSDERNYEALPEAGSDQDLVRQEIKRTASDRQSLLGDLLLKRLAGKDTGTWNGSQKGWASNNVRIWG